MNFPFVSLRLFFLILCLGLKFSSAAVLYVDSARASSGDGKAWTTSFRTLESAITTAKAFDTLRIARGTYVPVGAPLTQSAAFVLKPGMVLQGGYASGGVSRNPNLYPTVLSADKDRDDVGTGTTYLIRGINFKHVLWYDCAANPPIKLTLNGLSIGGGDALASGEDGGGLKVVYGNLRATNCRFFGNQAVNGGAIAGSLDSVNIDSSSFSGNKALATGGALFTSGFLVSVNTTEFQSNSAVAGGAIQMTGHYLKLDNSKWLNQHVTGEGAGVVFRGDSVQIKGCSFENMQAYGGDGGAVKFDGHVLDLSHTQFINCKTQGLGGGVCFRGNKLLANYNRFERDSAANGGGMLAYADLMSVDSCQFIGNVASEKGGGFSFGSLGTISRGRFKNNRSRVGGGAFGGASKDSVRIMSSRFEGNQADSGGAAAFDYSQVIVDSNVIAGNSANNIGGGLFVYLYNRLLVRNTEISGNSARNGGGAYNGGAIASDFVSSQFLNNRADFSGGAIMSAVWDSGYVDRCLFKLNLADTGSAISASNPYYSIGNSIFYKNQAKTVATISGIRLAGSPMGSDYGPYIFSNLLYQNQAGYGTAGIFGIKKSIQDQPRVIGNILWANSNPQLDSVSLSHIQKNIIQGIGSNAFGNFSSDPQFVAPLSADFRLKSNSPAINALGSTLVDRSRPYDYIGNPRLYGSSLDIGPMEFQGEPFAAPILLSRLDHLKLLPGKTLIVNLDSIDSKEIPLYVRFAGPLSTLQFNVVAVDTAVTVEYNPLQQTLAITPKPSFVTGQVKLMTLKAVHPTRPDLYDQKTVSLEMGTSGFDIRGIVLNQNESGIFEGSVKVTGNAYPLTLSNSRIYLGTLPIGAAPSFLAVFPYLMGLDLTESSLSVARGGFADPGFYGFQFNGSAAKVFLPGNQPTGLTLAEWARTQTAYRSSGRLAFTLPVTDGFEPAHLVSVSAPCSFERPITILQVVENQPHRQRLQWSSFSHALKSLTLWIEPQGPGAGPVYSLDISADSLNGNQKWVDNLQDLRVYHYRLVAVDAAGIAGTSELTSQTLSDNYSLGGTFSGLWLAQAHPMAVYIDHFEKAGWKLIQTVPVYDTDGSNWRFDAALTGEKYRATFKVPGFYSQPMEYQVTVNRASRLDLNFHLSAEPVVAKDSVKVEQRLGNGNLVITARTAGLFVDEKPVRLKLRWEGGFPERKIDSQEFAISAYHETALGLGRALWTMEIPRDQIKALILNRTSSFDRNVRYLQSEIVTTAFDIPTYRSGVFDYPTSSSNNLLAFASQLYAKPQKPWLGQPIAYSQDAIVPVVGGLGNPGVVAEVAMVPLVSGNSDQGTFPIIRVGKFLSGIGSTSMVPGDFAMASRLGAPGNLFTSAVGLRFPIGGKGALLPATAVAMEGVAWNLRLTRKGSYRPFVHLAHRVQSNGLLRLTIPFDHNRFGYRS